MPVELIPVYVGFRRQGSVRDGAYSVICFSNFDYMWLKISAYYSNLCATGVCSRKCSSKWL